MAKFEAEASMSLQTRDLSAVALGERNNQPSNELQPRLDDGIHLRWAFRRERGFPWHGYYVFRRIHRKHPPICATPGDQAHGPGPLGSLQLSTIVGELRSTTPLVARDSVAGVGLDLEASRGLTFTPPTAKPATSVELQLAFHADAKVTAVARYGPVTVLETTITGERDTVQELSLVYDAITEVELKPGPATLTKVCTVSLIDTIGAGWERLQDFKYPLCLPVAQDDYPCITKPTDVSSAQALALSRVRYGSGVDWAPAFPEIHDALVQLVEGGPAVPMHERENVVPPTDPTESTPALQRQRPLDVPLFASLHPAVAQLLGMYWVDTTAQPETSYDYIILADFDGTLGDSASSALSWLRGSPSFAAVDAWVVQDMRAHPADPLAPPEDLRAFLLPGLVIDRDGEDLDAFGNVGLRWELDNDAFGFLRPDASILYHLWRSDHGALPPTTEPAESQFEVLTKSNPILVTEPATPGVVVDSPSHWPPERMYKIDRALAEGWYSYRLNGIDIFGRHSRLGAAAPWFQWDPPPDPRPWYFVDPPGTRAVHAFAVNVLDKTPPPAPPGVETFALDPADPTTLRDSLYNAWREALSESERETVVGLRVRWRWPRSHMRQAPDTQEFRIYVHPGSSPPTDHRRAVSWDERRYVVAFEDHVIEVTGDERRYEVILPAVGDEQRTGIVLEPTLANPIAYANVSVSAVDGREHSSDAPKWNGTEFGNRFGNEGAVGTPGTVFRVLREPPPPPVPPPADSDRLFASRADYHSRSFFTYRWSPTPDLRLHVFRALDETLFEIDHGFRPRPPLSGDDLARFPPDTEPGWNALKRNAVAAELNSLDEAPADAEAQSLSRYSSLSNDALRVLAALPGNERAFTQRTIHPLDPDEPDPMDISLLRWRDRIGPDTDSSYTPDPALRAFIDELDGRASNRYFYRAGYVDRAHNRGPLSLSSPPVWLPDVVAPRTPVLTDIAGGDREIALTWRSNTEADAVEYRVFRTADVRAAPDVRRMTHVQTLPIHVSPSDRPAHVSWVDSGIDPLVDYHYRLVTVDSSGNASKASPGSMARAFDDARPAPPQWNPVSVDASTGAASLTWSSPDPQLRCLLQRRDEAFEQWDGVSGWLPRGNYEFVDDNRTADETYVYRLRVMDTSGKINRDHVELTA